MYVVGRFDSAWAKAKTMGTKQGLVSFEKGTTVVTMKIATSFLSYEQAEHSMALEIGSKDFKGVFAAAQGAWDALCGRFEIEGASFTQLQTFYSCLYRMYAYPNLYSENEGTNENPVWVYASPYKNGAKTKGILYTNNGFWDTYRTTWAGYALFTSEKDGELLNGIVQHYIDSGWIPRWICPGAVNCMVGTSSDIIFADAFLKGIDFNYEKAWESMVENASAVSSSLTNGGRPDNNIAPFLGYVPNSTGEGYSSSIEGYINDYGLYRMAEKMGLESQAEYYLNRCLKYGGLYNAEAGFFMGKSKDGVFSATAKNYDPAQWGGPKGDYTESVGWVNAFPAVFDGEGLVNLYGGREALAAKLREVKNTELRAGFCLTGPHREDLEILIDGQPGKIYGSQGQQRSAVLSMKLAEASVAGEVLGEHPVMLLDDVLSELDDARQTYLLTRIEDKQTFVTTCDSAAFARTNGKLVFVDHGTVREG